MIAKLLFSPSPTLPRATSISQSFVALVEGKLTLINITKTCLVEGLEKGDTLQILNYQMSLALLPLDDCCCVGKSASCNVYRVSGECSLSQCQTQHISMSFRTNIPM